VITMNPGFVNLFDRSRYGGKASRIQELEPESEEGRRDHEERERFAAAAIAFCLEHDTAFLQHFWEKVCCQDGDRESPGTITVEVEPRRWADLLLKAGDQLCVVEMKIGARLAIHQDPTSDVFFKPGGYGQFLKMRSHEESLRPRYVVLGSELNLGLVETKKVRETEVGQRSWDDFVNELPDTTLTTDLSALLSSFGIWQFTFKTMKDKKLSGTLGNVGSAIRIVESVRNSLGWPDSSKVCADPGDGTWWSLGIYLNPFSRNRAIKGLAARLQRENAPDKGAGVAWFGYHARPDGKTTRCVYLYCSKTTRKPLVGRLKKAGFIVEEETERDGDTGPHCAVFREGHDDLGDIDWFKKALEAGAENRVKK